MKNEQIQIFRKFPCQLLELKVQRKKGQRCQYVDLKDKAKLYITTNGELIITEQKLKSGQILTLKDIKKILYRIKDITYKRTSNDYPNEMFLHNFNGKENFYACNFKNNLIYFVRAGNALCEVRED